MVCPPWHVSLAWRSPRSIPTGQDGRRPLQHKLGVTYIYVLKCITHPTPPPDGVAFLLPPASTLPGLASHSGYTDTELHHYYLAGLVPTFLPPSLNFAKAARHTRTSNDNIDARKRPTKFVGDVGQSYALIMPVLIARDSLRSRCPM